MTNSRTAARIILVVLIGVLLFGCNSNSVVGKYVNRKNQNEYLELKPDRTFFAQEGLGYAGKYEVEGNTLTLTLNSGLAARAQIQRDGTIVDNDDKTWVKKQ